MTDKREIPKNCTLCRFFHWDQGEAALSDVTPGWDASIECRNTMITDYDRYPYGTGEFRTVLARAETCAYFEWYDEQGVDGEVKG